MVIEFTNLLPKIHFRASYCRDACRLLKDTAFLSMHIQSMTVAIACKVCNCNEM